MAIEEGIKYGITADVNGAVQGIQKVGKSFDKLGEQSKKISSLSFSFNQVLRETPAFAFSASTGILALSNNLPILFDNISAARKEGLSLGQVFKSLGAQFVSAGGLLSIGSLVFTIIAQNAQKAKKEAKEAAFEIKQAFDVIAQSTGGVQGEISKVNALASAVLNANLSYKERTRALEELKQVNKGYFGDLTLEEKSLTKLKGLVDEYTKALVANAVVKGFESEISRISQEIFRQEKVVKDAARSLEFYRQSVINTNSQALRELPKGIAAVNTQAVNASTQFDKAKTAYDEANGRLIELKNSYNELNQGIQNAVANQIKFKDTTVSGTKAIKEQIEAVKLLNKPFAQIRRDTPKPVNPATDEENKFSNPFQKTLPVLSEAQVKLREYYETLAAVQGLVQDGLTSAFRGFFDTLLEGGNAFGSFFSILGNIIKRLIAATLAAAALALVLSFIPGFSVGGLASGGGLSKFGQLFKNFGKTFGIPGFAEGGIVTGPTLAMVGEGRGPEAIIPLDKLNNLLGNMGGGSEVRVTGELRARGTDLVVALGNANKQYNRFYGG